MKIYLIDFNEAIIRAWKKYFKNETDVFIEYSHLHYFLDEHPNLQAIVSPANSFGIMTGGYDGAITRYFGEDLQKDVQKYIIDNFFGEQVVGTSCSVKIPNTDKYLIHTPTMRVPEKIQDSRIIYHCMRSTLIEAHRLNVDSVLIPAFGGLTGGINPDELAWHMYNAYKQIQHHVVNQPKELNFRTVYRCEPNWW